MARRPIPPGAAVSYDTTDPEIPVATPPALAAPDAPADSAPADRQPIPPGAAVTYDDAETPADTGTPWYKRIGTDLLQGTAKTLQGATGGLSDEIAGAGDAAIGTVKKLVTEGRLPSAAELKQIYTQRRDQERTLLAQADADHPIASTVNELGGSLLMPGMGAEAAATGAAKATGLGARALAAAKGLAPIAAQGAAAGVGYEDAGPGEVASPGDVATSALTGAAVGTGAGLAGKLLGTGVRKVFSRTKEEIKTGIIDELSRAESGAKATPTARKRLQSAGEAIYEELTTGPDGKAVQDIVKAPVASQGLAKLEPLVQKVADENTTQYDRFTAAGKSVIDVPGEYLPKLKAAEEEFRIKGNSRMAKGLEGVREAMADEATKTTAAAGNKVMATLATIADDAAKAGNQGMADAVTRIRAGASIAGGDIAENARARIALAISQATKRGDAKIAAALDGVQSQISDATQGTDLRWLRAHTTTMQDAAASKLGGLNEHETARTAKLVAQAAKGVLDDVMDTKAAGSPELEAAAKTIRSNNRRLFGLLSIENTLESRANQEAPTGGAFERAGRKVKSAVTGAGIGSAGGALLSGGASALQGEDVGEGTARGLRLGGIVGAGAGAFGNLAPKLGLAFDRRITNSALDQLRKAATGQGDAMSVIKAIASRYAVPERAVRTAYIRLLTGNPSPPSAPATPPPAPAPARRPGDGSSPLLSDVR